MREAGERFQIGNYWLGRVDGSPNYYAFWFDKAKRRTRRSSLGETDEASAKKALAAFALGREKPKQVAPADMSIAEALAHYIDHDIDVEHTAGLHLGKFFGTDMVSTLTSSRQKEFIRDLGAKGLAASSIRRYLTVLSAALNDAETLTSAPKIILAESDIADLIGGPGKLKPRRLTVLELARFVDAIKTPHFFRYVILGLTTLARPDAITDLTPSQFSETTADLNPAGRRQNKKFRPTVRIPPTLAGWLPVWQEEDRLYLAKGTARRPRVKPANIVHYKGKPVANTKKAFRLTALAAGLVTEEDFDDEGEIRSDRAVTPYTLRRSMSRLLRAEGVQLADIGGQLGHAIKGAETTEIYADVDPLYMQVVIDGIERILDKVAAHCKRPIRAPNEDCDQVATKTDATKRLRVV